MHLSGIFFYIEEEKCDLYMTLIYSSHSYKIFMFKCIGCDFETFLYKIHVPLVAHAIMGLSGIL
jgi:hypothetical protein